MKEADFSSGKNQYFNIPYADLEYVEREYLSDFKVQTEDVKERDGDIIIKQLAAQTPLEQDMVYMSRLYPEPVKTIRNVVEDECDQLEYAGSLMFDDVPDYNHLGMIITDIYEKIKYLDNTDFSIQTEELRRPPYPPSPCRSSHCGYSQHHPDYHSDGRPNWLRNLVEVIFYNELLHRRERYRNRRSY